MSFKNPHIVTILILILVVAFLGIYFYKTDRFTLIPGHDNQMLIPCAFKLIDPELYPKDLEIKYVEKFYPPASLYLWSFSYRIFEDIKMATYAVYLVYGTIYITGMYFLGWTLFKRIPTAFLVALFSIPSREVYSFVNMWGLFAIFDHPFARTLGQGLIPWVLAFFLKYHDDKRILPLVFLIMGLLTSIHNLTMGHLFIILMMTLSFQVISKKRNFSTLILPSFAFAMGAIPALLRYLKAVGNGTPDMTEVQLRSWYAGVPSLAEFLSVTLIDMSLPLAAGFVGYLVKRKNNPTDKDRVVLLIFISSIIIGSSILITSHFPELIGLYVLRVVRYYYLIPLLYSAYLIVDKIERSKTNKPQRVIIVILSLLLLIPSCYTKPLRKIGKEIYWDHILKREPPVKGINRVIRMGDRLETRDDVRYFMEMCRWVKENTPKSAHFLTPPVEFVFFRVHAQRGLVVSFKGRGWAAFSGESSKRLKPLFKEVERLYRSPECDAEAMIRVAKKEGAHYIVIDKNRHKRGVSWRLPYPPVFENKRFLVYHVPWN